MKTLRVFLMASALLVLGGVVQPLSVRAEMTGAGTRVLTGELVIINAAKNTFRLVEHAGSFMAPAGTKSPAFTGALARSRTSRRFLSAESIA